MWLVDNKNILVEIQAPFISHRSCDSETEFGVVLATTVQFSNTVHNTNMHVTGFKVCGLYVNYSKIEKD